MKIPMLDLVSQYKSIKTEIDQAVLNVLESGSYIMGSQVKDFEDNISLYLGSSHSISVASGSDALLLSLDALGIKKGDKVIVPTFTFFATAGAVARLGATPIFVDIDAENYNINLDQVEDILIREKEVKAVIPVHLFGLPMDMHRLMYLADKFGVYIIEDACQAINAVCAPPVNKKAGTVGHTGCFSFFPSKNLSCFGDGGLIVTDDEALAKKLRVLRVHGSNPKYFHKVVGYNSRLDTLQAAVVNVKLKYLNQWTSQRRAVAGHYNEAFRNKELQNLVKWPQLDDGHVFHQYVIEISNRHEAIDYLTKKGIGTAIYYPLPLHRQECFRQMRYKEGSLPVAEKACQRVLALPIDPGITGEQVAYIVDSIHEFLTR